MSVYISLSTTLRSYVPNYRPEEGLTINIEKSLSAQTLAEELGLPLKEIKIVMLNGRRIDLGDMIESGDRVAYFPAVGGG